MNDSKYKIDTSNDVVIFPKKSSNISQAYEQKKILDLIISYFYPENRQLLVLPYLDPYGLYKKWFPDAYYLDGDKLEELLIGRFELEKVNLVDLSGLIDAYRGINSDDVWLSLKYENMSVRKIHTYNIASIIMQPWVDLYHYIYIGEDFQLLYKFLEKHNNQNISLSWNLEQVHTSKSIFYIVDDTISEELLKQVLTIMENEKSETIILFLNNDRKYYFYQPNKTYLLKYILPFSIIYKEYGEEGDLDMKKEELVLYPYTRDDNLRKLLVTTQIDMSIINAGIEKNANDIENIFLRGILEAVERKLLYLINEST